MLWGIVVSLSPNLRGFDELINFDRLHRLFVDLSSLYSSLGLCIHGLHEAYEGFTIQKMGLSCL